MRLVTKLLIYIAVSFILAFIIDAYLVTTGVDQIKFSIMAAVRMFTPLAAVITILLIEGEKVIEGLKGYGLRLFKLRYLLLALSIPYLIYGLGVLYALIANMPLVNPIIKISEEYGAEIPMDPNVLLMLSLLTTVLTGLTINTACAFGEEIGWRGLLLDELIKVLGYFRSVVVIGVIWALWHAPLIVLIGFNYPHHRDLVGVSMFMAICIVLSAFLALLKLKSGSVIPSAVTHGTFNACRGLMLFTVDVEDELLTMPVGVLALLSMITIYVILHLALLRGGLHGGE
ncbi:MAG: hypothetical protein DRO18_07945 [Thermoprotei archaeon]|nr:MAG: hypothetical protein DRO18_07945 [Thermoprotei archaeon]